MTFKFNPKKTLPNTGTFFTTPSPQISQSDCLHISTVVSPIPGGSGGGMRKCLMCAMTWDEQKGTGMDARPSHYYKRKTSDLYLPGSWERQEWGGINPLSRTAALGIIANWNKSCKISGMQLEYKLADVKLACVKCAKEVSETYKDDLCYACHVNEKVMSMPPKIIKLMPLSKFGNPRNEGDIWKLPIVNSPMWTNQWAYQGSAKQPYIVSHRTDGQVNGSVTSDGWACSCMNFTRNVPRTECKHILKVMMSEGVTSQSKTAKMKMAGVDDAQLAAFKKWQKEQAEAGVAVLSDSEKAGKMKLFDNTGRKFR